MAGQGKLSIVRGGEENDLSNDDAVACARIPEENPAHAQLNDPKTTSPIRKHSFVQFVYSYYHSNKNSLSVSYIASNESAQNRIDW